MCLFCLKVDAAIRFWLAPLLFLSVHLPPVVLLVLAPTVGASDRNTVMMVAAFTDDDSVILFFLIQKFCHFLTKLQQFLQMLGILAVIMIFSAFDFCLPFYKYFLLSLLFLCRILLLSFRRK